MFKYLITSSREYILIFLTATIFFLALTQKSFSQENVFIIDNVKVEGVLDINFSREKYIDKAFLSSFEMLTARILLSRDLTKLKNVKLNKIKKLINSFQILEEIYKKDEYQATFKIFYNDNRVKKFLYGKNISFSQPKNISAVFYPILFINDEIQNFNENYFYAKWDSVEIKNKLINFILPLEDLDDLEKISKMKNRIEEINIFDLVGKYDEKNYVFALMNYSNEQLSIHIKTNFDNNEISKNTLHKITNIKDEEKLNLIGQDLKMQITDIWKESNIVNLLMPLSIKIKFQQTNLLDLDKLKKILYKISIIDNYVLEEININHSYIKIYYYGNPKRLKTELLKFGYQLEDDKGYWQLFYR